MLIATKQTNKNFRGTPLLFMWHANQFSKAPNSDPHLQVGQDAVLPQLDAPFPDPGGTVYLMKKS